MTVEELCKEVVTYLKSNLPGFTNPAPFTFIYTDDFDTICVFVSLVGGPGDQRWFGHFQWGRNPTNTSNLGG